MIKRIEQEQASNVKRKGKQNEKEKAGGEGIGNLWKKEEASSRRKNKRYQRQFYMMSAL